METKQNNPTTNQNEPPIILTDAAVKKIMSMMEKEGKPGYVLKVGVVTGGCAGLSYDLRLQKAPYENDIVFELKGLKVCINDEAAKLLKKTEIDYVDTLKESGFKYRNPNAKSSCGCGTSFS